MFLVDVADHYGSAELLFVSITTIHQLLLPALAVVLASVVQARQSLALQID